VVLVGSAGAGQLSTAKAKAAQIEQEITSTGQQITALDQQYLAAQAKKAGIDQEIAATQAKVAQAHLVVARDQATLRRAAVDAYVTGGSAATQNPLFSGNQSSTLAAREYSSIAEGNLGTAVAELHNSENQLNAQESSLRAQDSQAAQAVSTAQSAEQRAQGIEAQQKAALAQVNSQITTLIKQQQAQAAQAAQAAAQAQILAAQQAAAQQAAAQQAAGQPSTTPPPPSAGGAGAAAVAAAESQLGVPYRWAAETPKGTPNPGFDCSGLTAWAWGQAGVPLPHYSGAQMADSTPVPITDLQPGDLLFYGPGGSDHVAMYIGGGQMIEAPYTGAYVWITGLRLNTGNFAGAGRP
jgi:cell wall-associated NlpC family hydrolase